MISYQCIAPQYVQCSQICIITRKADQGMKMQRRIERRLIKKKQNFSPWSYFKAEISNQFLSAKQYRKKGIKISLNEEKKLS